MTHTDFKAGDLIIVTKPKNIYEGPTWNESNHMKNMEYLTKGTHVISEVGTYIYVYDERIKEYWSLDPSWCQLACEFNIDKSNPYFNVIRKIKTMQFKRKEAGYAF